MGQPNASPLGTISPLVDVTLGTDLLLLQAEYTLVQLTAEGRITPPSRAVLRDLSPMGR